MATFDYVEYVLAAAVVDTGTVTTVPYPTGLVQADFTGANAATTAYLFLNDNDRFEEADDEFDISYGASTITLTNKTGFTWAVGTKITLGTARGVALTALTDSTGGTVSGTLAALTTIATLAGTLTGTADGTMEDIAATAAATAGGATPTAAQVDTGVATAVASIVTGTNLQLKELQTKLNTLLGDYADIKNALASIAAKVNALIAEAT